ncbi:SHSP domain-containing protein [Mycena venus]|uniref:SHSP domain-containing protein n=1 Tax=Mycena venus TaxID=2733690 RepID=A0A8H6XN56_9AGAR|nr:SHSP domain-containing protein [Mycena venus]
MTRSRTFLMSRRVGYCRAGYKRTRSVVAIVLPLRMSPTRTVKSSRMSNPNSDQRQAARRMVQGIFRAIREGNLRVVHPDPKAPFKPRMELYDNPDSANIVATFELPGVKISDLSISVKQGVLLIHGERRARYIPHRHPSVRGHSQAQAEAGDMDVDSPTSSESAAHARLFPLEELRYGEFRRAIRLPPGADTSCINASLSDGLLTVSWPRSLLGR